MALRSMLLTLATMIVIGANVSPPTLSAADDPNELWRIVHDQCIPNLTAHIETVRCAQVNLAEHWAVLKDQVGRTQFLLMATDRVTGIEDPQILAASSPNYWQAAWDARRFVQRLAPSALASDRISLAINSPYARSQNQFHIHVDCIRSDVRDQLRLNQNKVGLTWTPIKVAGQEYEVIWISAQELQNTNLFALVANRLPPDQKMDKETMMITGAVLKDATPGFDLLVGRYDIGKNTGNTAMLQDHSCSIADSPSK